MRLLLLREKYLELLECGAAVEALQCLRHELAPLPLHHSDKHLQTLTRWAGPVGGASWPSCACDGSYSYVRIYIPVHVLASEHCKPHYYQSDVTLDELTIIVELQHRSS